MRLGVGCHSLQDILGGAKRRKVTPWAPLFPWQVDLILAFFPGGFCPVQVAWGLGWWCEVFVSVCWGLCCLCFGVAPWPGRTPVAITSLHGWHGSCLSADGGCHVSKWMSLSSVLRSSECLAKSPTCFLELFLV